MGDINKTTYFYRVKFKGKEEIHNQRGPLPKYFGPMIGSKEEIVIAELGAGPVNTIGDSWGGVKVKIYASDIFADEYNKFWKEHKRIPIIPIEYQDMEKLSYPDNMFDIVHCVNALDHTPNVEKAISEMKRVCKPGGWIYLRHAQGQKKRYGGMHYHNFEELELPGFSKEMEGDLIVNTWRKT